MPAFLFVQAAPSVVRINVICVHIKAGTASGFRALRDRQKFFVKQAVNRLTAAGESRSYSRFQQQRTCI
jgi:hypothetical protein